MERKTRELLIGRLYLYGDCDTLTLFADLDISEGQQALKYLIGMKLVEETNHRRFKLSEQ